MWHGWHWLSVSACRERMSDDGSGRKRVGMACRQLSCRRVSHSDTLRVTEDVECCIPPCSNRRRRNWWRTWLATTHPAVLARASWSKDRTVWVGEDRVLATRTGTMQKRAQCCEELSPCPHATHGGRCLLRSIHESGTTQDPRTESAIGCQWDVSGIFHLAALWRVVAFMLWSWQHFSQAGAKLSPSGYWRVRTPHSWQGCSACRDPARRSRRHSSSSSFIAQRNTAKRATPLTANLGTAARLASHFHDTPPGSNCKLTRDSRYCSACSWMAWYKVSLSCRRNWKCCRRVYWPATMRNRSATLSTPSRGVHAKKFVGLRLLA